jgi:hypothetical protein
MSQGFYIGLVLCGYLLQKLDSDQLSLIVSRPCATNPLWLKILSEELRIFGDFQTLDTKINQISDSVESLLTEIVDRLISEDSTGLVKKVGRI